MEINSTDVHRQLENRDEPKISEGTDGVDQLSTTTSDAPKHKCDISTSQTIDTLPKVLYLKKLVHPALQQSKATSPIQTIKEPIPKLIVSKLTSQLITSDGIRYITARKTATVENSDQSSAKQADAIKSTKIIIKGITSQDKRLVVCESPTTTEPLISPQSSPTLQLPNVVIDSNKMESKETANSINERINTPVPDPNEENRSASNSSTPRANREMKQLQKTMKESKVLTDFVTVGDATRRIKRKLNESEEIEPVTPSSLDASQQDNMMVRSRSLSTTKETNNSLEITSISIRRNTRSTNAEFSAKQRKFLAGIQKHSRDSDDEHSEDERGRGRRKIRKSGKLFPPLKVCSLDFYCFFLVFFCVHFCLNSCFMTQVGKITNFYLR